MPRLERLLQLGPILRAERAARAMGAGRTAAVVAQQVGYLLDPGAGQLGCLLGMVENVTGCVAGDITVARCRAS